MRKIRRRKRPDELTYQWVFVALVASAPLFFWFDYYRNDRGRAMAASVAGFIVLVVIKLFWSQKKTLSFWVAAILSALIQVPIVMLIPWPASQHSKGMIAPLGFPDFFLVLGIFKLEERRAKSRRGSISDATPNSKSAGLPPALPD